MRSGLMRSDIEDRIGELVDALFVSIPSGVGSTRKDLKLSQSEIQVAEFIKQGKTTKETAELLNLSKKTVESQRKNIRNKLGIKNTKENLRTHLLYID